MFDFIQAVINSEINLTKNIDQNVAEYKRNKKAKKNYSDMLSQC